MDTKSNKNKIKITITMPPVTRVDRIKSNNEISADELEKVGI